MPIMSAKEARKYEDGYEQGLKDVWEISKLINLDECDGGLGADDLYDIFGTKLYYDIILTFSAREVINKYNEWKKED